MKDQADQFRDFLATRRSIRRFTVDPVPLDLIEQLIAAACLAPSAHNRQPWRFVVVSTPEGKETLARIMGNKLRSDRLANGDPSSDVEKDVARSFMRITHAPILVVLCLTMEEMDSYSDEVRASAEHLMAVQSVSMAGLNLLLAAHAQELGACWMCAPLFAQEEVRKSLSLPDTWSPQGLILLGHPDEAGKDKGRKPVAEVILWR